MANLYLQPGETVTGLTFGGNVFGTTGNQSVSYASGVSGITVDNLVEEVRFADSTSSYTYQQQGFSLVVFSGTTQVAKIALQDDANGTLIAFANGRVEAKIVPGVGGAAPTLSLGGTAVPVTAAGAVVPAVIDGSAGEGNPNITLTIGTDAGGSFNGTGGNDIFNAPAVFAPGTITPVTTINPLDIIDGGAGVDTLKIESTGGVNTIVGANIKNIENLTFLGAGNVNGGSVIDVTPFSGEVRIQQSDDAAVGFSNVKGQTIIADRVADGAALSAAYDAAQTSAALSAVANTGSVTFNVNGTKLDTVNLAVDATAAGKTVTVNDNNGTTDTVKTVNVTAAGASTVAITSDVLETVNIAGAGKVSLTAAASKAINASTSTGGVTVTNTLANGVAFTGSAAADTITVGATTKASNLGAGNDTLIVTSALGTGATIEGGDGTDTVQLTADLAATLTSTKAFADQISGFEQVKLSATVAAPAVVNLANLDNIAYVISAGTGAAGVTQTYNVTFGALTVGQSVTVAGRTVTATGGGLTAAQVEAAFVSGTTTGNAAVSGALTGFTTGAGTVGDGIVVFSSTSSGPQAAPTISVAGTVPAPAAPSVVETTAAAVGVAEVQTVTVGGLVAGQTVVLGGRTVTANTNLTAAEVENAFVTGTQAGATVSAGAIAANFNVSNGGTNDGTFTLTYNTANSPQAEVTSSSSGTNPPTAPVAAAGATGTAGAGLTLDNVATGGTLELTGIAQAGITVNVKDAVTTAADVFNVTLNGSAELVNTGSVTIANVETINIKTQDSTAASDPANPSKILLNAADATSIVVSGNHGIDFTGSTLGKLTNLDASGVAATGTTAGAAGKVTFVSQVTDKALTVLTGNGNDLVDVSSNTKGAVITTGAGNDTVTGSSGNDTINLGAGNDRVISTAGLDTITFGAGSDVYRLENVTHTTIGARDIISDFTANTIGLGTSGAVNTSGAAALADRNGDVIELKASLAAKAGFGALTEINVSVFTNASDATTFIANSGAAGNAQNAVNVALDSSTGNVYIDLDDNGTADSVIQLTGVTTLNAGAFTIIA